MEVMTIQKYMHTSPRKLRLVADMVRKMGPSQALDVLRVTPKDAAKDLAKALETVLANAKQKGMNASKISLKSLEINESAKMRRYRAGTRGRAKPFKRRMAHIKIILTDDQVKSEKLKIQNENTNKKEKGGPKQNGTKD